MLAVPRDCSRPQKGHAPNVELSIHSKDTPLNEEEMPSARQPGISSEPE